MPALITVLNVKEEDEDGFRRSVVADALGKIGPAAKDAVPALIDCLKDEDPTWRVPVSAASALGEIGANAKSAIPILIETMERDDLEHRVNEAEPLARIAENLKSKADTRAILDLEKLLAAFEDGNLEPKMIGRVRRSLDFLRAKVAAGRSH